MATNNLALFLNRVLNDPNEWARFRKEPQQMVREANLTEQEQQLLMQGPLEDLRKYIGAEPGQFSAIVLW
jgi:hypothetical protein